MQKHLIVPNLRSSHSWLSLSQSLSPPREILLQSNELFPKADYSPMIVKANSSDQSIAQHYQIPKAKAETTNITQCGERVKILQFHDFEQFRILQRKLKFESEQSSCRSENQSQDQNIEKFQSLLVHTQILESGVFHQRIMMAATERSIPSHIKETLSLRGQLKDYQDDSESYEHCQDERININILLQGGWIRETLMIQERNIRFSNFAINIDCISKLKIMMDEKEKSKLIIKITVDRSEYLISVDSIPSEARYESYKIFLKIIALRFLSEISTQKTTIQSFKKINKTGKLLKKSQYIGNWEERLITIADKNLFSRKNEKSAYTFTIKAGRISQLWTRFDNHLGFPIIKAQHDRKTEFGLPTEDFESWVMMFLSLLESV